MTSTILLVHGAWHDGSCWDRVTPILVAAGYHVLCPTLPGLEAEYAGDPPGLTEQIGNIQGLIEQQDLDDILLVGHSWGGMVIAGVASLCANRLRHLVFLDAAVPADGDDFASQVPGQDEAALERRRATYRAMADAGGWLPPPPVAMVGITDPDDAGWLVPRLRPHPLRTWLEPVAVDQVKFRALPKTYVLATSPASAMMGYPAQADRAAADGGWTRRDIASGHDMMVSAPQYTADVILEAARR